MTELKGDLLKVTLPGPGERFMELAQKAIPDEWLKELNERQIKALPYLREKLKISTREYSELTGISERTALKDLKDLVEQGILRDSGKRRGKY